MGPAVPVICPYDHLFELAPEEGFLVHPEGMFVEGLLAVESSKPFVISWLPRSKT